MRVHTSIAAMVLTACLVVAGVAHATGIDGTITNGTTGAPATVERVNLIRGNGMSTVDTRESVVGSFHFEIESPGRHLIQVQSDGVTYIVVIPPGSTAPVSITVFDTSSDASLIEVEIPHFVVIADGPKVYVSRVFHIHNRTSPPVVIVGEPGPFRFDLPDDATVTRAAVVSTSMPLHEEPVDTFDDRGMTIAYAIKPGTTRYEIDYELPYTGEISLSEHLYHSVATLNAIVLPAELDVKASGLVFNGKQEKQGVSFLTYSARDLPADFELALTIKGDAVAPIVPGAEAAPSARPAAGKGEIKEVANRTGRGLLAVLISGIAMSILLLGGVSAARRAPLQSATTGRRSPGAAAGKILDEIAALDDRYEADGIPETEYRHLRAELKRRVAESLPKRGRKKKRS